MMSSEPARNLVHGLLLAVWAAVGLLVTLSALAHPAALVGSGGFWLWFVGFALLVHGGLPLALALVPRVFPLSLLRVAGLDVLGRA